MKLSLATVIVSVTASATAAGAVTVSDVITDINLLPITTAVDDTVFLVAPGVAQFNITASVPGDTKSPFAGTARDGDLFSSVQIGSSATLNLPASAVTFVWGSPDNYNFLEFLDSSGNVFDSIRGDEFADAIPAPQATGFVMATFTPSMAANAVRFTSTENNAFEFASLTVAPVPLPASALLLMGGLAGFGLVSRRKAKTIAA